jgi:hypothetical protein
MPLDEKNRLKLEKTFMAFGSLMKAADRGLADEGKMRQYADAAWTWSVLRVDMLVDELWYKSEKAGLQSPPPSAQESLGETDIITVAGITLQKTGNTKDGRPWKLYKITDQHNHNYFTFHTSFQLGESYEVDWEWQEKDDRRWRTIPNTPRPVSAYKVGSDGSVTPQHDPVMSTPDDDIPF